MKNIRLVTWREYLAQVRKKSFILLTIFTPLLIIMFGVIIFLFMDANSTEHHIVVLDESGLFQHKLPEKEGISFTYESPNKLNELKKELLSEATDFSGILFIPKPKDSLFTNLEKEIELIEVDNISFTQVMDIEETISKEVEAIRMKKLGISADIMNKIRSSVELKKISLDKETQTETEPQRVTEAVQMILSYVLMYVVFMFIIIYGTRVMRSILEEKNNRVVEIIISSVKPRELMLGKILGTTLVAITQFIIWIAMTIGAAFILQIFLAGEMSTPPNITNSSTTNFDTEFTSDVKAVVDALFALNYPLIIFVFLIYFFFGYLFYSSFFAAIGASVDAETETQQFTPILIIPLVTAVYVSFSIINNPSGPVAFWFSLIPITSPVAMVSRISFGVPWWEIALSMVVLLISTYGMVWLSAKIYRTGILMYGKKTTFKELWKWIRQ